MDEATLFRGYSGQSILRREARIKARDARLGNGHLVAPVTRRQTVPITKQCARCVLATLPASKPIDLCEFCRRTDDEARQVQGS